jgi:putative DNA primase/helicase
VTVKDCPTRADAVAALKLLEGLLVEFPFVQKGKTSVSRSVALATMLSTVARGCMDVVPLSAFNAHVAGTGKTYLVNLISTIATGRPCPVISINPADPAEAEKRIASALLAGYPLVSLDNVNGELRSDLLCQAVEQPLLRVRVFGVLELVEIENTASFVTTGNNLKLVADLTRRSLRGDLDAVMERPDQRLFGHDPIGIVRADRGKFVSACLTIVRAFQVAGCPGKPLTPMVSYGQWTKFIRAPLVWLGQPDPAESVEAARDDDPELEALTSFITVFDTTKNALVRAIATQPSKRTAADGFSVQELTTFHSPESDLADFTILQEFKDALKRIAPGRDDTDPKKLGKWLSKHEGRVVRVAPLDTTTPVISAAIKGDRFLRLSRNGTATSGGVKWLLEETKG